MRRALLLSLLFPLVTAPTAGAEVRLVDSATGASRTVLRDDPTEPDTESAHLIRFADDATVLVRRRGRALRIGIGGGNVRRVPWLDKAEAVGPGGRSIHLRYGDEPRVTRAPPTGGGSRATTIRGRTGSHPWRGRATERGWRSRGRRS